MAQRLVYSIKHSGQQRRAGGRPGTDRGRHRGVHPQAVQREHHRSDRRHQLLRRCFRPRGTSTSSTSARASLCTRCRGVPSIREPRPVWRAPPGRWRSSWGHATSPSTPSVWASPPPSYYRNQHAPEQNAALIARTPLGRIGQPEDIADAVSLLASSDARWITGQLVLATGGIVP